MGTPKIPLQAIVSDDCEVVIGRLINEQNGEIVQAGAPFRPHTGETVNILPIPSLGEVLALGRFGAIASGERTPEAMIEMDSAMDDLCEALSRRIISWDWTDMLGDPLPQPYKRPDIIKGLTAEEIMWLRGAVSGETPGARKNGSRLSQNPSSAGASRRRK